MESSLPTVSVIIPAHNEEKTLSKVLEAVYKQDYPVDKLEVIVIDDCSTDNTPKIVERFPIKYIRNNKNLGLARSLNIGIENSKSNIVITLHADCIPLSTDWIKKLVRHFDDQTIGGVTSYLVLNLDEMTALNRYFCYVYVSGWHHSSRDMSTPRESGQTSVINFVGDKCDAYRRNILEAIGGFDPSCARAEDIDISEKIRQLEHKLILDYDAKVSHILSSHQSTLGGHMRKAIEYAAPQLTIFSRYHYFSGSKIILSFIFLLYVIPIFLGLKILPISQYFWFLGLEYSTAVLFLLLFSFRRMPSFREKEDNKILVKICVYLLMTLLIIGITQIIALLNPFIILFYLPVFIGLSILLVRAVAKGYGYLKEYKEPIGVLSVAFLSFVWDLLYSIGFLRGVLIFRKRVSE